MTPLNPAPPVAPLPPLGEAQRDVSNAATDTPAEPLTGRRLWSQMRQTPAGLPLSNFALVLAYEGSPFMGWQIQPHGPSVQGELERVLTVLARMPAVVHGAGRTDAGVHALNQIAHVRLPAHLNLEKTLGSLNALLPEAIVVKAILPVDAEFHARHSARGKVYRYHIQNRPFPSAFARNRAWWLRRPLDVEAMREAASPLVGTHDFSAFRAKFCEARTPVRTLHRITFTEGEWGDGTLRIEMEGTAFLQHMVRIITGTLVATGLGRLKPSALAGILESRRREEAGATAPPHGLHLARVLYEPGSYGPILSAQSG
ncbi:MAG: tRNA pseudouridine(38-40) synthase TruA [Deltaproteobacteria bacterium]|nr:tRNA pseudouridine(38-40) synthase TruA [Deltaproteobacteria bacterium]